MFVIGGMSLFEEGCKRKECTSIWLTEVNKEFNCDTWLYLDGYLKDNFTVSETAIEKKDDDGDFTYNQWRFLRNDSPYYHQLS